MASPSVLETPGRGRGPRLGYPGTRKLQPRGTGVPALRLTVHTHATRPCMHPEILHGHAHVHTQDTQAFYRARALRHARTHGHPGGADTEQQTHMPRAAQGEAPTGAPSPFSSPSPFHPVHLLPSPSPVLSGSPLPERGRLTWMRGRAGTLERLRREDAGARVGRAGVGSGPAGGSGRGKALRSVCSRRSPGPEPGAAVLGPGVRRLPPLAPRAPLARAPAPAPALRQL